VNLVLSAEPLFRVDPSGQGGPGINRPDDDDADEVADES
jgi:hypothetical protein